MKSLVPPSIFRSYHVRACKNAPQIDDVYSVVWSEPGLAVAVKPAGGKVITTLFVSAPSYLTFTQICISGQAIDLVSVASSTKDSEKVVWEISELGRALHNAQNQGMCWAYSDYERFSPKTGLRIFDETGYGIKLRKATTVAKTQRMTKKMVKYLQTHSVSPVAKSNFNELLPTLRLASQAKNEQALLSAVLAQPWAATMDIEALVAVGQHTRVLVEQQGLQLQNALEQARQQTQLSLSK